MSASMWTSRSRRLRRSLPSLLTLLAGLTAAVVGSGGAAWAARRENSALCPGGRFAVAGDPVISGGPASDALVVQDDGTIALASGCAPMPGRLKASRRGTKVKVKWASCAGLDGKVKLRALIVPACDAVMGKVKARHFKRKFAGDRVDSVCADGSLDGAEACDDGNTSSCDGCAGDCGRFDRVCGDGLVECGEVCDGPGTCPEGESCDDGCACQADSVCTEAEASICGAQHYCSAAQDCLCIRSAEGPVLCGQIPPVCEVPFCQTSADCAGLGPGYFCDSPNSGCCNDGELPRCIAPCGTQCPPERTCGSACCAAGDACVDGVCTPPEPCADDSVTEASLAAARAALEGGALAVDVSEGGCVRYTRTLDGGEVTSDALTVGGEIAAEYAYTPGGATGRQDADLDGFFESDQTLTFGTDPEIVLEARRLDPGSGEVTRRELRMGSGDTVHVLVEEYGTVVNQFDTPAEQAAWATRTARGTVFGCSVDGYLRYASLLQRCMARTSKCLQDHGRKDVAREILRTGLTVLIRCGELGGAYARANARQAGLGKQPYITVDPAKVDSAADDFVASTMCHELMHFGALGLHDPALEGNLRRGEMDPVYACEELCGFSGLGSGPTKCHCATCLETVACDPRCQPYRECDPQMGAICPCPARHFWYPTYTQCKTECPSGLSCFGYSECINLDRGCG